MKIRAVPLKYKLPFLLAAFSLLAATAMQYLSYTNFRAQSLHAAEEAFFGNIVTRNNHLAKLASDLRSDVLLMATSPAIERALTTLSTAFHEIEGSPAGVLQAAYITHNPNPQGQRELLSLGEGPESYHLQHDIFHSYFLNVMKHKNYYDVLLVDPDGDVVYSVAKENDFATNVATGASASTGLGLAVKAAQTGGFDEVHFSDFAPYGPKNGLTASFLATAVENKAGQVIGTLVVEMSAQFMNSILHEPDGLGDTGQAFLVGSDMRTRSSSRFDGGFSMLSQVESNQVIRDSFNGIEAFYPNVTLSNGQQGISANMAFDLFGTRMAMILERDWSEIVAPVDAMLFRMITILAIGIAAVIMVSILIAQTVTRPISRVIDAMKAVADGDLSTEVVDFERKDEVGEIAMTLEGLRQKLIVAEGMDREREQLQAEQHKVVEKLSVGLENLSMGNLSQPLDEVFPADYEALRLNFNSTLDRLNETISQVVETSESIRARSTEISRASEDLSNRTENQAATLEETAAALDQLTGSVKSAAEGGREVASIVHQARKEAEESGAVVQSAVSAMTEIERSSDQISQIIGVIDDIAFQTNLLALNAGVEAARAGDAGRGFAVVASEVRALAQRSSGAAKEIKTLIGASTQHVRRGVDQVGLTGDALGRIVERVAHISTLVSDIASAAGEQSTGLAEINIGVTQLDQVTQQNAAMVEESTAASQMLHQEASALAELVSHFLTRANMHHAPKVANLSLHQAQAARPKPQPVVAESPKKEARVAASGGKGVWQEF